MMTDDVLSRLLQDRKTTIPSCLLLALFGPDRPGWRRLFLRVKRTAQLRARTSEFDPTETSITLNDKRALATCAPISKTSLGRLEWHFLTCSCGEESHAHS